MAKKNVGIIIPMYIEPNGSVSSFLKAARDPCVKKEYAALVKRLKADPTTVGAKLRRATWGEKSLDGILEELQKA